MGLRNFFIVIVLLFFNLNSYTQNKQLIRVGEINVSGDKITHKPIILRELEFNTGDTISEKALDAAIIRSKQNLLNRSLFNYVFIDKVKHGEIIDLNVRVIERWYIWPIPILEYAERNLNVWWENKDFTRLNFGLDLRVENFRGRMENLNFIVKGGYDQTFIARWKMPYLTKNQIFGMGMEFGYKLNHEVPVNIEGNKYVYFKSQDDYARKTARSAVSFTFRPGFNFLHELTFVYTGIEVNDSVLYYNPDYTFGKTNYNFISLIYTYKQDYRDFKPYPLKGYYFDIQLRKDGIGIFSDEVNQILLDFNFDHYFNIYKRLNFAWGFRGRTSYVNNYQPFFLAQGIGLNGFEIRGYELYVINSQQIAILKSNLKFTIIPKRDMHIKWLKSEKFSKIFYALYANIFFDAGYGYDEYFKENNPLSNKLLYGYGAGLDLVSYYDVVLGFSYGINRQGEKGFFISLVAPI